MLHINNVIFGMGFLDVFITLSSAAVHCSPILVCGRGCKNKKGLPCSHVDPVGSPLACPRSPGPLGQKTKQSPWQLLVSPSCSRSQARARRRRQLPYTAAPSLCVDGAAKAGGLPSWGPPGHPQRHKGLPSWEPPCKWRAGRWPQLHPAMWRRCRACDQKNTHMKCVPAPSLCADGAAKNGGSPVGSSLASGVGGPM